jgi:hypothetical protein
VLFYFVSHIIPIHSLTYYTAGTLPDFTLIKDCKRQE